MTDLLPPTRIWFTQHYSHAGFDGTRESALESLMEDWAFLEAVSERKIPHSDLSSIEAFEDRRHWRIRINMGLYSLGYDDVESESSKNLLSQWKKANAV